MIGLLEERLTVMQSMFAVWRINVTETVADPGFPRGGRANPRGWGAPYDFAIFLPKIPHPPLSPLTPRKACPHTSRL